MARSKVDACLLCEKVPCECARPARKTAAPRPKSQAVITSAPAKPATEPPKKISARDAMKARAAKAAPSPVPIDMEPRSMTALEPDDQEFYNALVALAPILHPEDIKRHAPWAANFERRLVSERARDWRRRRNPPDEEGADDSATGTTG